MTSMGTDWSPKRMCALCFLTFPSREISTSLPKISCPQSPCCRVAMDQAASLLMTWSQLQSRRRACTSMRKAKCWSIRIESRTKKRLKTLSTWYLTQLHWQHPKLVTRITPLSHSKITLTSIRRCPQRCSIL